MPTDLAGFVGETRTVPGLAGMALALEVRISHVKIVSSSKRPGSDTVALAGSEFLPQRNAQLGYHEVGVQRAQPPSIAGRRKGALK